MEAQNMSSRSHSKQSKLLKKNGPSCWHTHTEWVKETEIASRLPLRSRTARMTKQFGKLIYLSFFPISLCVRFSSSPLWLSSSKNICNKMLQGQELQQILQMLKDNMLKFKQIHARASIHIRVCVCLWLPSVSFFAFLSLTDIGCNFMPSWFSSQLVPHASRVFKQTFASLSSHSLFLSLIIYLFLAICLSVCMFVWVWCFTFKSLNAALMPFYFRASQLWVSPA